MTVRFSCRCPNADYLGFATPEGIIASAANAFRMIAQPDDKAPATLRASELIGKFHGENAATTPIGWRNTVFRIPGSLGITRP